MNDLISIEIGSIGLTITGKTPSSKFPEDFGNEYMFITPSDNFDDKTIYHTKRYLSKAGLSKLNKKSLPPNSILVSCIGSAMGKVSMNYSTSITNQQINSIVVNSRFDPHYIYYQLKNNYRLLRNAALGSTALPMLNKTEFDKLKIVLHDNLSSQKAIAKVLLDLDAKIELNNRINSELESMAKLIYDYWFVQFDFPISAEQAQSMGKPELKNKPYKSSGGKMIYNEKLKREIPEGWEVNKIKKALKTDLGGTPSTENENYWNGAIPWLNSGEIANFPIISSELKITQDGINNSATTLMPAGSCVLSITRHLRPSILAVDSCVNQSVVGFFESDNLKSSYIYPYLVNEIPRLMSLRTGAQQPHINKGIVDASFIITPPNQILEKYYKLVDSEYQKIINNAFQNQKLSELRDWLLPMLMNGQVTVKDAEGYVNGAELSMAAEGEVGYGE